MPFQHDAFQNNAFQTPQEAILAPVQNLVIFLNTPLITTIIHADTAFLASVQSVTATLNIPSIDTSSVENIASPLSLTVSLNPPEVVQGINLTVLIPSPLIASVLFYPPAVTAEQLGLRLKDRQRLKPVYLVEIALKNSGPTLYFSDRNIIIGSQIYEDYLGDLSGIGDEVKRLDSSGLNADITLSFKNDSYMTYNYLVEIGNDYPFEGAECIIKEVYIDDISNAVSSPETVFKGALDEPEGIDLMGFTVKVSNMVYYRDKPFKQDVIDTATYPNAYEDIGKIEPVVYGKDILMPCLRVDWGAKSTLKADITSSSISLELSDASRFPSSGSLWIDEEKIGYASKAGNVLKALIRGQSGTTATSHRAGGETWEHKSQYDCLIAGHELYSIGDIYAEIDNKFLRVTSGASAAYENGRHKLRATEQINVKPAENIDLLQYEHKHQSSININHIQPDNLIIIKDGWAWSAMYAMNGNLLDGTRTGAADCETDFQRTIPYSGTGKPLRIRVACRAGEGSTNGIGTIEFYLLGALKTTFSVGGSTTPTVYRSTWVDINNWTDIYNSQTKAKFLKSGGYPAVWVWEIWYEIEYDSSSEMDLANISKTGGLISVKYVDRFHAVVSGYKDPDGNYGGAGTLIERPDRAIKHFLVKKMGFDLSDIDNASFSNAGTSYASAISGGYKFGFVIDGKIKPSEFLKRLAFEARSTLRYVKGKWYLDYIPDTRPSAIKTITKEGLAGEFSKFTFSKTSRIDIANDLTAKFKRNYSRLGSESEWDGTSKTSDSASILKYGIYPRDFEFDAIRAQAMADSVLAHILKQRKQPCLITSFPVFWEHFDLKVGDTVEIDNPLYDGKKFFIEEIKRLDKFRAEVRAVEWW